MLLALTTPIRDTPRRCCARVCEDASFFVCWQLRSEVSLRFPSSQACVVTTAVGRVGGFACSKMCSVVGGQKMPLCGKSELLLLQLKILEALTATANAPQSRLRLLHRLRRVSVLLWWLACFSALVSRKHCISDSRISQRGITIKPTVAA